MLQARLESKHFSRYGAADCMTASCASFPTIIFHPITRAFKSLHLLGVMVGPPGLEPGTKVNLQWLYCNH